jgi:hypothetical protein
MINTFKNVRSNYMINSHFKLLYYRREKTMLLVCHTPSKNIYLIKEDLVQITPVLQTPRGQSYSRWIIHEYDELQRWWVESIGVISLGLPKMILAKIGSIWSEWFQMRILKCDKFTTTTDLFFLMALTGDRGYCD